MGPGFGDRKGRAQKEPPKRGGCWSPAAARPPAAPAHPGAPRSQSQPPDAAGSGHPGCSGRCLITVHEQQTPRAQPLTAARRGRRCRGRRGHPAASLLCLCSASEPCAGCQRCSSEGSGPSPSRPSTARRAARQRTAQGRGQNPRALEPGRRAEAGPAAGRHAELNNARCANPRGSAGKRLVTNAASATPGRLRADDDRNFPSTTRDLPTLLWPGSQPGIFSNIHFIHSLPPRNIHFRSVKLHVDNAFPQAEICVAT